MDAGFAMQPQGSTAQAVLTLAGGFPHPDLFPRQELASAFAHVVSRAECSALQYGWPEGNAQLRGWIASRLRARGADANDDDVIVTNGAQQAIALAVEQLVATGRTVGVDAQTYPGALDLFRNHDIAPVVGPTEVSWIYTMPGVANPTGNGMTPATREGLLRSGAPIIADEAYAELRFDGRVDRPLLADARDRVWHVGTFSKVVCPGLRIGWLVAPRALQGAVLRSKRDTDLQAASLAQAVMAAFLERDDYDQRLTRTRAFYAARAERFVEALARHVPSWSFTRPEGGFSVFVQTDLDGHPATLLASALRLGVSFDPGGLFWARRPESPSPSMRLCYSSVPDENDLEEAARRLARLRATPLI